MNLQKGSTVTRDLNNIASNTFSVDTDEGSSVLLTHPLACGLLFRVDKQTINTVSANLKDSTERCLDYANINKSYLDLNTKEDIEFLGIAFFLKRKFTSRQKKMLSDICGSIASIKFNDNLKQAMDIVSKNTYLLDDFNLMWYTNFKGVFTGQQRIVSKKQRDVIFNMAGYVLAELETPSTRK